MTDGGRTGHKYTILQRIHLYDDWVEETDFGPILFTNFGGSFPLQNNCRPRQWAHGSSTALYTDSWTCVMWLRLGPVQSLTLYRAPCKV